MDGDDLAAKIMAIIAERKARDDGDWVLFGILPNGRKQVLLNDTEAVVNDGYTRLLGGLDLHATYTDGSQTVFFRTSFIGLVISPRV